MRSLFLVFSWIQQTNISSLHDYIELTTYPEFLVWEWHNFEENHSVFVLESVISILKKSVICIPS